LPIAIDSIQSQQAAVYDLFPTLLGIAGVEIPRDHPIDGQKLDRLLSGKIDPTRDSTFLMHYPHAPHRTDYFTVYRTGPWKVIYHYFPTEVSGNSHYQLFNLKEDPFEQNDVASTQPEELKMMMQGLASALEKQNATYPVDKQRRPLRPLIP
jgi:arylsulfatase A-like enzyme